MINIGDNTIFMKEQNFK